MSGRHRWADRDDELVQALADRRGVPAGHCGDDLAAVLAAWVEAVDTDLPPPGPVAAPAGSRRHYGLRTALLRAAVAAGIVAAVAASGLAAAERAQPGSPLWSLSRLVDPDRAASLEARRLVTQSLLLAERDAAAGSFARARQHVADARARLSLVRDVDGRQDLDGQLTKFQHTLDTTSGPGATAAGPTVSPDPTGTPAPGTPTPGTPSASGSPSVAASPDPSGSQGGKKPKKPPPVPPPVPPPHPPAPGPPGHGHARQDGAASSAQASVGAPGSTHASTAGPLSRPAPAAAARGAARPVGRPRG